MRTTWSNRRSPVAAALAASMMCLASTARAQQMQRDILAGHVTGPNGAIAGATVSVLPAGAAAGTLPQTARSDIEGRWPGAIQEGPGAYVVRPTAIGMGPQPTTAQ